MYIWFNSNEIQVFIKASGVNAIGGTGGRARDEMIGMSCLKRDY